MRNPKLAAAVAILLLASTYAYAQRAKIIANPSIAANNVSIGELKSIFLQEKSTLNDGTRAEPVLQKGGATHEAFVQQYLDKSDWALQIYYRNLVFTGRGSLPKSVGSDAEMVAYVARTKGAIGYVSPGVATPGVKVLPVK